MIKFFWKVWLRLNLLTKDVDNDYIAEVSTVGKTLRNEDIARLFVESGSEIQYETALDILNRADRIRREKLQEGYRVQTGVCHITPRISGNWLGGRAVFNPDDHKVTLSIVPTAEMRAALAEVSVDVLGVRNDGAFVGLATDVTTGLTDGTITPGGQIIVAGEKIKIEPVGEAGVGLFITDDTNEYELTPLAVNRPKELIAIVPASLAPGTYSLYVATRHAGSNYQLKEIRRIDYGTPLIVT